MFKNCINWTKAWKICDRFLHFKSFSTHVAHSVKKWCVQFIRHQIYGQKLARSSKTFTNLNLSLLISFYLWSYTHRNTINLWIRHHRDQIFRSALMSWPLLGGKLWINSPYTHFQQIPADAVLVCFLIQCVMTVSVCFSFSLNWNASHTCAWVSNQDILWLCLPAAF